MSPDGSATGSEPLGDPAEARRELVNELRREGIRDKRVLSAIGRVPREVFVPPAMAEKAYLNVALPIGQGQTISQPFVVALMTESLGLRGDEYVLEVGTGSGYQAAILGELARSVVSVERVPELLATAEHVLAGLGYRNVDVRLANGTLGWPHRAPYDAILVAAGGPDVPRSLLGQLALGGRLVIPVGKPREQKLMLVTRNSSGFKECVLGPVRFVPLVGAEGWPDEEAMSEAHADEHTAEGNV
jgi:protein-L-isoaspartate(D-aspartate) O-methyltransferase